MKKALITGITGQDGYYLSNFLIKKGYEVYGLYRRSSLDINERLGKLVDKIYLVEGDLIDSSSIFSVISKINPDEIYNLGAQSFVPASWSQPIATTQINTLGTLNVLEAIRQINPKIKFYQASSSEMFGKVQENPQTETTPFYPRSPYGVTKVYSYWITRNYAESYGLFAVNGILFNHESPKRGKQFVTRKISHSVAKITLGLQESFKIGNLNAKRDWGYAGDYVEAMWLMLQQEKPEDFIISTGESHSVREFIEESFRVVGKEIYWEGQGLEEVGKIDGKIVVEVNPKFYRPAEVDFLLGDSKKAKDILNWEPKIKFKELVKMMVKNDLDSVIKEI